LNREKQIGPSYVASYEAAKIRR